MTCMCSLKEWIKMVLEVVVLIFCNCIVQMGLSV